MRAYLDFLLLKNAVPQRLVEALMRHLDAERFVEVNGKLTAVPDNAAEGRATDLALKLVQWADLDGDCEGMRKGQLHAWQDSNLRPLVS